MRSSSGPHQFWPQPLLAGCTLICRTPSTNAPIVRQFRFAFCAVAALWAFLSFSYRGSAADYTAQDLHTLKVSGDITGLAFAPDGKTLAVAHSERKAGGTRQGKVTFWSIESGKETSTFETDLDATAIAFADEGKSLVLIGAKKDGHKWDCRIAVFDVSKRELTRSVQTLSAMYATLSNDGKVAALVSPDKDHPGVELWDAPAGKRLANLTTKGDPTLLAFSTNAKYLAAGRQGELRVWDVSSRKEIATLPVPAKDRLYALAITPDGKSLVAELGERRPLQLFDLADATLKGDCVAYSDYYYALVASSDGKLLASTCFNLLYLISTDTWQSRFNCETNQARHTQHILFSPDSQIVATTSEDKTIRLFKVSAKQ